MYYRGFQSPGQPMYQQQPGQQATFSQQQQAAGTAQNPWGAAYNPYQQFGAQVSIGVISATAIVKLNFVFSRDSKDRLKMRLMLVRV